MLYIVLFNIYFILEVLDDNVKCSISEVPCLTAKSMMGSRCMI